MGVDIQTYRSRIGTYKHSRCGKTNENFRHSRGSDVAVLVKNIIVSNDIPTVGCVLFIGVLLMIAGVEPNPGPMEKGFDSSCGDEVPGVVKGVKKSVDVSDKSFVEEPQDIPRIRISGLIENTNKEMLAMYFEYEERNGGGKVKNIAMDKKGKFATIDFEEKAGVDAFMLRNPKRILGMNVTVEVFALPVQSNDIGELVTSTSELLK
ncbi:uncharacterized protein LOC132718955 [Ruditapes philippinarum]|uniref:uncharacterized protein LOC132718955 n=1 Tax=Ruditapes philippinarum TaxID=129788 RepID=UPI00295B2331|nr:uncharacterized protein LOC132718955 [Ruditapes philippinarum]